MGLPAKVLLGNLPDSTPVYLINDPVHVYWKDTIEIKDFRFLAYNYNREWDEYITKLFAERNISRQDIIPYIILVSCLVYPQYSICREVFGDVGIK